jgi:hypothetical protein
LLTPEQLVQSARIKTSPFHDDFTWDDTEAADKWRLYQARQMLRVCVEVVPVNQKDVPTRVFVSLTTDRKQDGGYRIMTAVLSNKERRDQLLQDALAELRVFEMKYSQIEELAELFLTVKKISSNVPQCPRPQLRV